MGDLQTNSTMTDQQADFQTTLRLSGIDLPESDIALIFELAKACEKRKKMDLRQWAKVFAEHASEERKNAVAKASAVYKFTAPQRIERKYKPLTIAKTPTEWPKAC